jgi:hypothetical protein
MTSEKMHRWIFEAGRVPRQGILRKKSRKMALGFGGTDDKIEKDWAEGGLELERGRNKSPRCDAAARGFLVDLMGVG